MPNCLFGDGPTIVVGLLHGVFLRFGLPHDRTGRHIPIKDALYTKALPDIASSGGKVAANDEFIDYDKRKIARLLHEIREGSDGGMGIG